MLSFVRGQYYWRLSMGDSDEYYIISHWSCYRILLWNPDPTTIARLYPVSPAVWLILSHTAGESLAIYVTVFSIEGQCWAQSHPQALSVTYFHHETARLHHPQIFVFVCSDHFQILSSNGTMVLRVNNWIQWVEWIRRRVKRSSMQALSEEVWPEPPCT